MSEQTTAMAVAALRAAYPRQDFPDESVRMYVRMLSDLDPVLVGQAVERLMGRSAWLPAISEIRLEVAEATTPLPTAAEAWTLVSTAAPPGSQSLPLPPAVRESLDAVGGRWTIMHSERPETIRSQFLRDYQQRRDTAMLESIGARAPRAELTRAEQAFGALPPGDEIPESTSIRPRPVWARWLRRQELSSITGANGGKITLTPPSPEEKHDAILVLRDWCAMQPGEIVADGAAMIVVEAQRIMDEASA